MRTPVRVFAVGQFPPPYNGFTIISRALVDALGHEREFVVLNTANSAAGPRLAHYLRRFARLGGALLRLTAERLRGRAALYLPCEGDAGLVMTLALVCTGRLLGMPITLHHHSFGYIDRPSAWMHLVVRQGGRQLRHVFLSEGMQQRFEARYGPAASAHVQTNAAFVAPAGPAPGSGQAGELVLGHLSNLTREKGLYTFLELFRCARAQGLPVRALLAGPVQRAEDRAAIEAVAREHAGSFDYLGPVMGERKDAFYAQLDVFVFPTEYANEAQPVVIYEASARGNLVASNLRGCIDSQLTEQALRVERPEEFVARTLEWLRTLAAQPLDLAGRKSAVAMAYRRLHERSTGQLRCLAGVL